MIFKILGNCEFFSIFFKCVKNLPYIKFQMFGVFKSPGPVRKHMPFDLIKMHPKIFFFSKNVDFYVFESQKM